MARRAKSSRTTAVSGEDAALEELYGSPLAEFTATRDRLAAELRAAGDSASATRVKSLRKPSTAVWAINQVARRQPRRMEALLQAGERMREAGAAGLREATAAHHELVWELLQQATNVLAEAGIRAPGDHLDGIRRTLQSAPAAAEHERELLRRGMLDRELEPADVGEVMRMMAGGERPKTLPAAVEAEPPERPARTRGAKTGGTRKRKATRGARPVRAGARKATRGARPVKSTLAGKRKATRGPRERAVEKAARAAEREAERAAEREAERAEQKAAKAAERERREETRRRAAAVRAYEKASRAAQQRAKQAERATAAARKADQQAHAAEEAAREARERADAAERAAAEAEARAVEAEAMRVAAEKQVEAPRRRASRG